MCDICKRFILLSQDQVQWWLDGVHPIQGYRVTRCPQHINGNALRIAGVGRTKSTYAWARLAKQMDEPPDEPDWLVAPFYVLSEDEAKVGPQR